MYLVSVDPMEETYMDGIFEDFLSIKYEIGQFKLHTTVVHV